MAEQTSLFDEPDRREVELAYQEETLASARAAVVAGREKGIVCPCCDQLVKVYKRKLNAQMASAAVWLSQFDGYVPIHTAPPKILLNREYSRLALWWIAEAQPGKNHVGARRGMWRLTDLGRSFVKAGARVPAYMMVLNGAVVDASRETISIDEVEGFDMDEVWNG